MVGSPVWQGFQSLSSQHLLGSTWAAPQPLHCNIALPAVFGQLVQRSIAVHAQEAHGHGDSEPKEEDARCLVWDYRHLVRPCAADSFYMSCSITWH